MSTNRVAVVEAALDDFLASAAPTTRALAPHEPLRTGSSLTAREALALFEDQLLSRTLDVAARELKRTNRGFYTIGSAGHENNAVFGALLRVDDPCFLHYRSGAFMAARARHLPGSTPAFDQLLSLCASADDPISGGRHKVFGSRPLWVPPQTSTIASHLPKAAGLAISIARARRAGVALAVPRDAIVFCSFGDASANHATALSGFNLARYAARVGSPAPILFCCEDNGIGISVDTPPDWIRESWSSQSQLRYFDARGDLDEVFAVAREAVEWCRGEREPAFVRLATERLWGHAGTDVESTYRSPEQTAAVEARDPLLANARLLVACGAATPQALRELVRATRARVAAASEEAAGRPKLSSRAEVMAPLAPYDAARVRASADRPIDPAARARAWGESLPEQSKSPARRNLAGHVNAALTDELARSSDLCVFGEDVGRKGGVYGVTVELQKRFGVARCFDTLLDETAVLGLAQGAAHIGCLPIPEIEYLAYLHNALDQLRGEACSLAYFSNGQFANPLVVRVAGLAYQKGFGGHFHNDNSIGALRDIPGLMLAVPSRGDDAARMLRGAISIARECGRVVVFLEPIALYHEKDLYADGDGRMLADYAAPGSPGASAILPGDVGVHHPEHRDVLIVSYANGLRLSLRAARVLRETHGVCARVLDLRWLAPLPLAEVAVHARDCAACFVVDECRATGAGVADALVAHLAESGYRGRLGSVRAADSYVPLGPATAHVLVGEDQIVAGVVGLLK
jgi:2-oxoisovalerate dehydrogenase E1 component